MSADPEEIDIMIKKKYEFRRKLGRGVYSVVWQAMPKQSKRLVAVKRIFNAFSNRTDGQRSYREVSILRQLGSHPNIVGLHEVIASELDKDLYLVMDYLESDLSSAIRSSMIRPFYDYV